MGFRDDREIQELPVLQVLEETLVHQAALESAVNKAVQEVLETKVLVESLAIQGLLAFQEHLVQVEFLD